MCGITGFTHRNWNPGPERIEASAATLVHRGPDQQGVFHSSTFSMGATRLKILDLKCGDQPIFSPDGDTGIVFNGEIYNHLETRKELEALGHKFFSHSDTETLLHAFLEWDTQCFQRLRGMFAAALWTKSSQRLVLVRDRLGIKPLYIVQRGEDLYFGSELKAIFVHPEIERRLSMPGLDCYLSLNYVPSPWTLVEGIEKLPPGYWMEWRNGRIHSEAYWSLPSQAASSKWTLNSAKEELDSLLQQSAREHLLSDVPLGVWLSGGVDSTAILHYTAQATGSRLKTFSISFRGRSFDETPYIREAVRQYGTEHEELDLNPNSDLVGAVQQLPYYSDEPSADAGALPVWFLSKLCKTQTTVALSGEGGDELFGGYLTYRANELAAPVRHIPQSILRLTLKGVAHWPVSDEKIGLEYKVKRFLEGCLMSPERAHVYWNGTFSDEEKGALLKRPGSSALNDILRELRGPSPLETLNRYLRFDQMYFLPDDILNKSDRMSMAHSVEVRPPFLDHRIVEFMASLPAEFKVQGSRQKVLFRELLKGKLPPAILNREKMGFDIPAHEWLRGPLRELLIETLREGTSSYGDVFHADAIQNLLERHFERKTNAGYHLWGLLILFLWMKQWNISAPSRNFTNSSRGATLMPVT